MFSVAVKTLDGGNYDFSVEDEIKVSEFKNKIEERLNIPISQQRLIFQGRILLDDARLLDCGVRDKVVHLVPRPPPSVQRSEQSEPASTTPTSGGIPWGSIDMQQAIQDITAGIFSGLGEFGRNLRVGSSGPDANASPNRTSALASRELVFSRLHRQASRLLQQIILLSRSSRGSSVSSSSPPPEDLPSVPVSSSDCLPADGTDMHYDTAHSPPADQGASGTSSDRSSPMVVDQTGGYSQERPLVNGEESSRPVCSALPDARQLSLLADMLSRYRRLWQSAEPCFERWEAMLNCESRSQLCPETSDSKRNMTNEMQDVPSTDQDPLAQSDIPDDVTLGGLTSEISQPWQARFFSQISRLLHLNAHMLHLISDFAVVRVPHSQENSASGANSAVNHTVQNSEPTTTELSAVTECSESAARSVNDRRTYRVLFVPEGDAHLIRARINVEPIFSVERQLPSSESTHLVHGRTHTSVPSDRRRSQSAADPHRHQFNTLNQAAATESRPSGQSATTFTPLRPGSTAIIHRVDIPVISMNMINLPVPASGQPAAVHSVGVHPPPSSVATTSPAGMQSSGLNEPVSAGGINTNPVSMRPLATTAVNAVDPFLPCHSRHFDPGHRSRISTVQGSFAVPLTIPTMAFMPGATQGERSSTADSSVDPRLPTVTSAATGDPVAPANSVDASRSHSSGNTFFLPEALPSILPQNLTQQIASFVSAATNVATSAAFVGGLDMNPFNVLLSSAPIQFTVGSNQAGVANMAHPLTGTTTSSTVTENDTTRPQTHAAPRITWIFGRDNPALSAVSVTAQTPDNSSVGSAQSEQFATPAWAEQSSDASVSALCGENRIANVFMGALVETVWLQLCSMAMSHNLATNGLPVLTNEFTLPQCQSQSRVSTGLLSDLFAAARRSIRTRLPNHLLPASMNSMRLYLRHLVEHANRVLGSENVVDALAQLVFDGFGADATVGSETTEGQFLAWIRNHTTDRLVDVRASLLRLFKTDLNAQFELWNTSPTNTGFGSALLLTLTDCCLDFLCLTDLLVSSLSASLGLQQSVEKDGSVANDNAARCTLLGTSFDFSHLLNRLSRFIENLSGSSASVPFFELLLEGIKHCVDRYINMDITTLTRRVNRLRDSCLVFRSTQTPPPMEVDCPNYGSGDDIDMEDLPFVDASSELPNAESVDNQQCQASFDPSGKASPLPDWTTVTTTSQPSRPLDPHPDSIRFVFDHPTPEGWHAVLPAEWVGVVASDVATMSRLGRSSESGREHFSDAYISGMPAKRRKIMKDRSCSLAKPPDAFLADCLSDAIRGTCSINPCTENGPCVQTPSTDSSQPLVADPSHFETNTNLVLALRDLVSEKISDRLVSDPDFDPVQFPLSNEVFGHRKS